MAPTIPSLIASTGLLQLAHSLSPAVRLWWVNLDACSAVADPNDANSHGDADDAATITVTRRRVHACRQALRHVLAAHYSCATRAEDFVRNAFGKPRLRDHPSLHFNMSHAEQHGLIGVCTESAIGVDIEAVHAVVDANVLAEQHFTARELSDAQRRDGLTAERFLTCWTRKEACSKALGVGLSFPPNLLDVGCSAEHRSVQIHLASGSGEMTVCSVSTPGDSIAAVSLASTELEAMAQRVCRPTVR